MLGWRLFYTKLESDCTAKDPLDLQTVSPVHCCDSDWTFCANHPDPVLQTEYIVIWPFWGGVDWIIVIIGYLIEYYFKVSRTQLGTIITDIKPWHPLEVFYQRSWSNTRADILSWGPGACPILRSSSDCKYSYDCSPRYKFEAHS